MLGVLFIRILFLSKSSIQTFEIQYIAHILLYSISQRYNFESNLQPCRAGKPISRHCIR